MSLGTQRLSARYSEFGGCPLYGSSKCVYGNSSWYIHGGPLFVGGPLLGGSVIGVSAVIYVYVLAT